MSFLRRTPAFALLAALVLAAGPVASAACGLAMPDRGEAHGMPTMEGMSDGADEMPPCHGDPADAPPADEAPAPNGPSHECGSACCASEPPALPPATPAMTTAALVPLAVVVTVPVERTAGAPEPPPEPPLVRTRLHADLQRFLI